jgi:hypothetical protein
MNPKFLSSLAVIALVMIVAVSSVESQQPAGEQMHPQPIETSHTAVSIQPEHAQRLKLCCECICAPHYPDPFCVLGDCIWVDADEPCPSPYIDPRDCPVEHDDPQVPSYLQPGDLLFCECKNFGPHSIPGWDHVAMYVGDNLFVESVPTLGVRVASLSDFYAWAKDITYGFVDATPAERNNAVAFVEGQIGEDYQYFNPLHPLESMVKDPDPESTEWYCAELVWAAYYSVQIDIDCNGWAAPAMVLCYEISLDGDTEPYMNEPPSVADRPAGRDHVYRFETRPYLTNNVDPEGMDVFYRWKWGSTPGPLYAIPVTSGVPTIRPHTWPDVGTFDVKVIAVDLWGYESPAWSDVLEVTVHPWFGMDEQSEGSEFVEESTTFGSQSRGGTPQQLY